MLEVGTKAMHFQLYDDKHNLVSLDMFKGKKIVLYFYPKDNTSGCSSQAVHFKHIYDKLTELKVVLIGISKDSIQSHQNFISTYHLPFILLSDPSLQVIKDYDVWHEKKLYGKTYMGTVRTTYIIDESGYIIYAKENVNPSQNPNDVLNFLLK